MKTTKNLVLCALFAALITIGTYIKIPTPLLPLTFQTLFVVLSGLVLGRKYGAVSVCVYVAAGLIGLPVFTGSALSPTFGYIVGFIPGSWLAGYIAEKFKPCFLTWMLGALAGIAVIYALGIPYYYLMSKFYLQNELGAKTLLVYFVLMPMPGDIFKSFLAGLIMKRLTKLKGK
ncbi:MAG: biotin transporter BioY [Synergistales bacterium]|nr:biotin transporter BioY [Synergistales bacterium]MDY6404214.1 biotin transporter BioY [Synergistales bacterium]MDY6411140.1 biotin transporter BioY [Synergistales bacterium]MDY6413943.1 biotin transporter BioY [Synergistales bacterium]MDY6421538.1 biotin transporter BioY [Synergistales bacterium]